MPKTKLRELRNARHNLINQWERLTNTIPSEEVAANRLKSICMVWWLIYKAKAIPHVIRKPFFFAISYCSYISMSRWSPALWAITILFAIIAIQAFHARIVNYTSKGVQSAIKNNAFREQSFSTMTAANTSKVGDVYFLSHGVSAIRLTVETPKTKQSNIGPTNYWAIWLCAIWRLEEIWENVGSQPTQGYCRCFSSLGESRCLPSRSHR